MNCYNWIAISKCIHYYSIWICMDRQTIHKYLPLDIYWRVYSKWMSTERQTIWRSQSRVLASACCPFHNLWYWKFTLQMNLLFQIDTRQLFCPLGYSSVVSSTSWYVLFQYALCGKTNLERFHFRYFSRQSSHHQAYMAVAGDSDGHSTLALWSLWSVSCLCYFFPAWINSNSRESLKGAQCLSAILYCSVLTGVTQATGHTYNEGTCAPLNSQPLGCCPQAKFQRYSSKSSAALPPGQINLSV